MKSFWELVWGTLGYLVSAFLVFAAGGSALASRPVKPPSEPPLNSYEYTARIPATGASCQDEAAALGARFQSATGIVPTQSICREVLPITADNRQYTLYSLSVSYAATAEASLYSADYGLSESFGRPDEGQGFYFTFASCLAAADQGKLEFEAQTGLQAVSVSCLPGRFSYNPHYVLRIDGFGPPSKTLRLLELKFIGQSGASESSQIDALIASLGGELVAKRESQRLVYGAGDFAVKYDDLGRLNSKEQCESERQLAQNLFANLGSKQALVFCLPGYGKSHYLEAVREGFFLLSGDMGSAHGRYLSFTECMNALARLSLGDAAGALCHASDFADGQYELEVYSRL